MSAFLQCLFLRDYFSFWALLHMKQTNEMNGAARVKTPSVEKTGLQCVPLYKPHKISRWQAQLTSSRFWKWRQHILNPGPSWERQLSEQQCFPEPNVWRQAELHIHS